MRLFKVGPSPFVKKNNSVKILLEHMILVLLALCVVGAVFCGYRVLILLLISLVSAFVFEFLFNLVVLDKKGLDDDLSSIVTAIMFTLISGANTPLYMPVIAMFVAIIIVKMLFGGFAKNIFNPAGSGAVVSISLFGAVASTWLTAGISGKFAENPLNNIATGNFANFEIYDFLFGKAGTIVGAVCLIAVLAGGLYLIIMGVIDFKIPLMALLSFAAVAFLLNGFDFNIMLCYLIGSPVIFVSFFMLTDYTTSPNSFLGQLIYCLIFGISAYFLVKYNVLYSGSVLLALIFANAFTPLLDRVIRPRYFGEGVKYGQ
ncbi:MAG: RnfABCDGE type electron transport complex subunit D [Clostridia bacterium]|nr:RnfABCDGE type electron transport complex subunit D [Clostridia bacterium]